MDILSLIDSLQELASKVPCGYNTRLVGIDIDFKNYVQESNWQVRLSLINHEERDKLKTEINALTLEYENELRFCDIGLQ